MKYSRILLKISGESLAGNDNHSLSEEILDSYAKEIVGIVNEGCQVAVVTGGGNIFRGLKGTASGVDRLKGDQMGMLATVINGLALENAIKRAGGLAKLFTAIRMEPVGELYNRDRVAEAMKINQICILAGGTGNPFFTTDTAAALRAIENGTEVLLKGTRVDGVYNADPEKDKEAVRFDSITFEEVIERKLRVMDQTAFTMCMENNMPVIVFNMNIPGNLMKVVKGEKTGSLINSK